MNEIFRKAARKTSEVVGSAWTFVLATTIILIWLITGPFFNYSDTWQLVINTGTTIVTFLMVFLIQNTQNRESRAINLKIDELIRSGKTAKNELMSAGDLSDADLEKLESVYKKFSEEKARRKQKREV